MEIIKAVLPFLIFILVFGGALALAANWDKIGHGVEL